MPPPPFVPNAQLEVARIPRDDADWPSVARFAATFDGVRAAGSFEECATIANARRANTLTELRICLYFEYRRWRHFGEDPDEASMLYIRSLVDGIRTRVAASADLLR